MITKTVRSIETIIQILTKLLEHNSTLKISIENDNNTNNTCLTTIISIDQKNLAVYLDIGRDEAFNNRLIASQYVSFTKEDDIEIRWVSTKLSIINLPDGNAIKIALPECIIESMIRSQHHKFYPVSTPIVNPVPCLDIKQTTVAIIDDDPFQHEIINNAFREEPYEIISLLHGENALTFLLKTRPDIILLDINMPEFSGIEILQWIQNYKHLSGVPIIMITREKSKDIVIECMKKGATNYIVKPFTRTLLLEKTRTALMSSNSH
jgi:CheY-like chemotaxis protein